MDSIPQQYQTLAKAGIAGGVAAVAAGLLQSGTSPMVPLFVGGTVLALTHFGLTTVEKTQQQAAKQLSKAKKSDKKVAKADKKGDKKKADKAPKVEEEPEEEEEVVEAPKKVAKKGKKEAAPVQTPKKEAAPKKGEQKAAPKAAGKAEAKAAATPKKAAGKAEGGKAAAPKAEAKAAAKAPAKGAAKAEGKKADAKKPAAAAPKAEAAAPSKNKKKKAPKVVEPEPEEEEDEEEEQDGWITQKAKPRVVKEKPVTSVKSSKAASKKGGKGQEEDDEDEEKEEAVKEESLSFNLPTNTHGAIFGEKGNTIARIQLVTNTRVKMPAKDEKSETITVRGSAENIKLAQQIIQDVAKQGYSSVLNPNLVKVDITVPSDKQPGLIGKSGSNIQDIQKKTDTKITVPRKGEKSNTITIAGPPDGVAAAQAAIKSILSSGFSELTHPDYVMETLSIPREQTRFLIGPKGQTIQKIQTSSGVKVNIPDTETEEQKREAYQVISITGPAPNVRAAKNAILMSMQPVEDEVPDVNSPWAGSASYSEDAQWE